MRIACWNCGDGLWGKRALLDALPADLLILSEVRQADFDRLAPDFAAAFYTPSASARGLASFCRVPDPVLPGTVQLRPEKSGPVLPRPVLRRFRVPDRAECYQWLDWCGVDILGAWVKPQGSYVRPARQVIDHFLRRSRARHRIILGDLNLNPGFERHRKTGPATELVATLARHGLRSLYHEARGEPMGEESQPTHHFTFNAARPFHIDFIFASAGLPLRGFGIGAAADWIGRGRSDHVPLWADLGGVPGMASAPLSDARAGDSV